MKRKRINSGDNVLEKKYWFDFFDSNYFAIEVSTAGRIQRVSQPVCTLLGYQSRDLLNRQIHEVLSENFLKSSEFLALWSEIIVNESTQPHEYEFVGKNEKRFRVIGSFNLIDKAHTNNLCFLGFDISNIVNDTSNTEDALKINEKVIYLSQP